MTAQRCAGCLVSVVGSFEVGGAGCRLRRCRPLVLPEPAGMGQAPHILAKAASDRIRVWLSPAVTQHLGGDVEADADDLDSCGTAALVWALRWRL